MDTRSMCHTGPRNIDGTWMGGVARGQYRQDAFPAGTRFGCLTVLRYERYVDRRGRGSWEPVVACTCGWEGTVVHRNMALGLSTRCRACGKKAAAKKRYWKYKNAMPDDAGRARLLNRLSAAVRRCHNTRDKNYKHYGARGIRVWEVWRTDKAAFLEYVQTVDGWDDPSREMDRIDVNRGYEPGNIRFCTRSENMANRRRVEDLEERIRSLEAEVSRLRSGECRAET